jgi:hypothetical protein
MIKYRLILKNGTERIIEEDRINAALVFCENINRTDYKFICMNNDIVIAKDEIAIFEKIEEVK